MAGRGRSLRLQDVATEAGVSIATASRSLAGAPGVSDTVAERVRGVARTLGYVANVHARSLAAGTSASVGLVVHEIGDPYFSEIASGVLEVAAARNLSVQICHTGRDAGRELDQLRQLVASRVGVVLVAGSGHVDPAEQAAARKDLDAFRGDGGRVAVIGRHHLGVDAVLPDNHGGGRAVAAHLLGLGHRRIAVVAGSRTLTTVADRLAGVADAFAEAGLVLDESLVLEVPFTRAGGKLAAERLVRDHPEVTGVLALNDDMAIGVISALRGRGVSVPGDVSVAGFDDVAVAGDLAPPLTTVRLPMAQMGGLALEMALREPSARPRRRQVGIELVVRDSTAAPHGR